jgi:hypothetical protein
MRPTIPLLIFALFVVGCQPEGGRFELVMAPGAGFWKLDKYSGKTWRYTPMGWVEVKDAKSAPISERRRSAAALRPKRTGPWDDFNISAGFPTNAQPANETDLWDFNIGADFLTNQQPDPGPTRIAR